MRVHDGLKDDAGQNWEILVEQRLVAKVDAAGQPIKSDRGTPEFTTVIVGEIKYRKDEGGEWLILPSWAEPSDEWKINLCWFDEDEETGDLIFWKVQPGD